MPIYDDSDSTYQSSVSGEDGRFRGYISYFKFSFGVTATANFVPTTTFVDTLPTNNTLVTFFEQDIVHKSSLITTNFSDISTQYIKQPVNRISKTTYLGMDYNPRFNVGDKIKISVNDVFSANAVVKSVYGNDITIDKVQNLPIDNLLDITITNTNRSVLPKSFKEFEFEPATDARTTLKKNKFLNKKVDNNLFTVTGSKMLGNLNVFTESYLTGDFQTKVDLVIPNTSPVYQTANWYVNDNDLISYMERSDTLLIFNSYLSNDFAANSQIKINDPYFNTTITSQVLNRNDTVLIINPSDFTNLKNTIGLTISSNIATIFPQSSVQNFDKPSNSRELLLIQQRRPWFFKLPLDLFNRQITLATIVGKIESLSLKEIKSVYATVPDRAIYFSASNLDRNLDLYQRRGEELFTVPGTYLWRAPAEVASVSVLAIGGGGGGSNHSDGGGGGGLGWRNDILVIPGQIYTVRVGAGGSGAEYSNQLSSGLDGGDSWFINSSTVAGLGGSGGGRRLNNPGGGFLGEGGGWGGAGGTWTKLGFRAGAGGGGAGGFTSNGGRGGDSHTLTFIPTQATDSTDGGQGGPGCFDSPFNFNTSGSAGGGGGGTGLIESLPRPSIDSFQIEYLVIGGGGGGGGWAGGGGGGAGGYRTNVIGQLSGGNSSAEPALTVQTGVQYAVIVGSGGSGGITSTIMPTNGTASRFSQIVSAGGGRGSTESPIYPAGLGGSGGGGSASNTTGALGTAGQGFSGGNKGTPHAGGGGGGAGGPGGNSSATGSGAGGAGLTSTITGYSTSRGGGGGGGSHDNVPQSIATAGGAAGAPYGTVNPSPATVNTGGGGGGAGGRSGINGQSSSSGGSGVVILRYSNRYNIVLDPGLAASSFSVSPNIVTIITAGAGAVSFVRAQTETSLAVEYLVVSGGGGGNFRHAGGGGGGGVISGNFNIIEGAILTVTVGSGGAAGAGGASSGSDSQFFTIRPAGGGSGGNYSAASVNASSAGISGGSGGGAGSDNSGPGTGGTGNTPAVSPSQGSNGGNSVYTSGGDLRFTGGGGGSGGAGETGQSSLNRSGNGGPGVLNNIDGNNYFYGGGGGGSFWSTNNTTIPTGNGGLGGGGGGGWANSNQAVCPSASLLGKGGASARNSGQDGGRGGILTFPTHANGGSGGTNTGGGGGGSAQNEWNSYTGLTGGSGGSGVVIVRYSNSFSLLLDSGLNATTSNLGDTKITVFTQGTGSVIFYRSFMLTTSSPIIAVQYLIIGGGGGGGSDMGGGGGAGGLKTSAAGQTSGGLYPTETLFNAQLNRTYSITVGGGGAGAAPGTQKAKGGNGTNSSITSMEYDAIYKNPTDITINLVALGGGGGASAHNTSQNWAGNGGSGGGASGGNRQPAGSGPSGVSDSGGAAGLGTAGQGFDGASSIIGQWYPGGGGGAGGPGSTNVANGGPGLSNNILGTVYFWAGGGAGSGYTGSGGNGGIGGGGGGAVGITTGGTGYNNGFGGGGGSPNSQTNTPGGAGGLNTGSGGGGGSHYSSNNSGGSGGSGIVILRYSNLYTIEASPGMNYQNLSVSSSEQVTLFTGGIGQFRFVTTTVSMEYLLIGGGGGGGSGSNTVFGGGGGAGGFVSGTTTKLIEQPFMLTVGAGGASASNGGNTGFFSARIVPVSEMNYIVPSSGSGTILLTYPSALGATFFKITGGNAWDNSVHSFRPFTAPCTIEFSKSGSPSPPGGDNGASYAMIGWTLDPAVGRSFDRLIHCAYPYREDAYSVHHMGTDQITSNSWSSSQRFYIVYDTDGSIKHYNGSKLLYSVFYAVGQTLYFDCSIYSVSSTFAGFTNVQLVEAAWNGGSYGFTNDSLQAIGGGGGGTTNTIMTSPGRGYNGGSGGGGGWVSAPGQTGGQSLSSSQGFAGGSGAGTAAPNLGGGGGGGAGGVGGSSNPAIGGSGGLGRSSAISGTNSTYASGGGGSHNNLYGLTLPGGGATGGAQNQNGGQGSDGTLNTGGGGGGSTNTTSTIRAGGLGGSGVIILRYSSSYSLVLSPGLIYTTTSISPFTVTTVTGGTGVAYFSQAIMTNTSMTYSTPPMQINFDGEFIIVGGGGGAGAGWGGGGGAGGLLSIPLTFNNARQYNVTVGAGGSGALSTGAAARGSSGTSTVFGDFTVVGGGGGGGFDGSGSYPTATGQNSGGNGGSGGGAGARSITAGLSSYVSIFIVPGLYTFTVPAGVTSITVCAIGGGGAGGRPGGWGFGAPAGSGGVSVGTLTVIPGNQMAVTVGGGGTYVAGSTAGAGSAWGGGGSAAFNGVDNSYGGGGGGYSGIFSNATRSQATALIIAGGGGGGGSSRAGPGNVGGGGGGLTGQDGVSAYDSLTAYRGQGGTQSSAGADASSNSANSAGNQGALQGGNSRTNSYGGGGGGGYWGGSGGGYAESNTMGGGGGGSGFIANGVLNAQILAADRLNQPIFNYLASTVIDEQLSVPILYWSYSDRFSMTYGSLGTGIAHGPLNPSAGLELTLPTGTLGVHNFVRYRFKWHFVDSSDNETSYLEIDGQRILQFTKIWNQAGASSVSINLLSSFTWTTSNSYSYAPWGGNRADGFNGWFDIDTGWFPHSSSNIKISHYNGLDQSSTDEAAYISHSLLEISMNLGSPSRYGLGGSNSQTGNSGAVVITYIKPITEPVGYFGTSGFSDNSNNNNGGGGGGGGGSGSHARSNQGGNGGSGFTNLLINTAQIGQFTNNRYYLAGGGGGGAQSGSGGTGGIGGGATGKTLNNGDPGLPNTGGGGGGSGTSLSGGPGGSGVVVIRYPKNFAMVATSGLTSMSRSVGNNNYTVFTAGTGSVFFTEVKYEFNPRYSLEISTQIYVEYLVVAGGGGGGGYIGGGGGGGGFRTSYFLSQNSGGNSLREQGLLLTPGVFYYVQVGAGGNGGLGSVSLTQPGTPGSNSQFHNIVSFGGGAGGSFPDIPGGSGGSGGGSGGEQAGGGNAVGTRSILITGGSAVNAQGFNGGGTGIIRSGNPSSGSGGGGAGARGEDNFAGEARGGSGGQGLINSIDGNNFYYSGGGGGGNFNGPNNVSIGGPGGIGGGGGGGIFGSASSSTVGSGDLFSRGQATSGTNSNNTGVGGNGGPNTGGGGGGTGNYGQGGTGGSGIVIIRYKKIYKNLLRISSGLVFGTFDINDQESVTIFYSGLGTAQFAAGGLGGSGGQSGQTLLNFPADRQPVNGRDGGLYGGGGSGGSDPTSEFGYRVSGGSGANGAVRIIYGSGVSYPYLSQLSNVTGNTAISQNSYVRIGSYINPKSRDLLLMQTLAPMLKGIDSRPTPVYVSDHVSKSVITKNNIGSITLEQLISAVYKGDVRAVLDVAKTMGFATFKAVMSEAFEIGVAYQGQRLEFYNIGGLKGTQLFYDITSMKKYPIIFWN